MTGGPWPAADSAGCVAPVEGFFEIPRRFGGAIIAASGSDALGGLASSFAEGRLFVSLGMIGGGAMGAAFSSGSSPGNTQTFLSLS